MADNGIQSPVIGVAFDGTGYGDDGNIWGGEFLIADYRGYRRVAHLEYLPLPGGATAIKKPYRTAAGYLTTLFGEDSLKEDLSLWHRIEAKELAIIQAQLHRKLNCPLTSSVGRLFDAVAALLGVRYEIDYEGQAAVELEMLAHDGINEAYDQGYPCSPAERNGVYIIPLAEIISAIVSDLKEGVSRALVAARFHNSIARILTDTCRLIAATSGIRQVTLSGGVFQNRLLLRTAVPRLESAGFSVLTHRQAPANDGGISLGQAVIASATVDTPGQAGYNLS